MKQYKHYRRIQMKNKTPKELIESAFAEAQTTHHVSLRNEYIEGVVERVRIEIHQGGFMALPQVEYTMFTKMPVESYRSISGIITGQLLFCKQTILTLLDLIEKDFGQDAPKPEAT
jgi:hypothetical protein